MYDEPKIVIFKNKIDVLNYECIDHFDENKIIIKFKNNYIVISGESLIISKLISDEVLIIGNINKLEFR